MEKIYYIVEINKALQNEKETINYSILKNDKYGVKITKSLNNEILENNQIVMNDIFETEDDVKALFDSLINQGNDLSQLEYVVEDYKKMYHSSVE